MAEKQYVQIAGNVKTGTSLLSALLDGHPKIVGYPGESGMTGCLFPVLSDPSLDLTHKVDVVCRARFHGYTQPPWPGGDWETLERMFRETCDSISNDAFAFHRALLEAYYAAAGADALKRATIWLDKSPLAHLFADEIYDAFPSTKFIHMVRNPKDNYASIASKQLRRVAKPRKRMERSLYRYRIWSAQSFWYARRNADKYGPEAYRVVRFEDLCQKPSDVIPEICDFLGIEETESLYQPTRAGRPYGGNNFEGKTFDGIYAGNVSKWRSRMPEYYARVMECQPLDAMSHYGYPIDFNRWQRGTAFFIHWLRTRFQNRDVLLGLKKGHHQKLYERPAAGVPGI
jgi:hypothetical protein